MTPDQDKPEPQGCLPSFFRMLGRVMNDETGPEPKILYPYDREKDLLSKGERAFYGALCRSIGTEQQIFAKVRLADLICVRKGTENRQGYQNKINSKHIDFVICDKSLVRPVLAVELDDKSHDSEKAIKRDTFVDEALKSAGLPILRVRAARTYDASTLAQSIRKMAKPY